MIKLSKNFLYIKLIAKSQLVIVIHLSQKLTQD